MLRSFDKAQDRSFERVQVTPLQHGPHFLGAPADEFTGPMPPLRTALRPFVPHPLFRHPDVMTLLARWWSRGGELAGVSSSDRLFEVGAGSQVLARCHWQLHPKDHPTLLLVHGFEGCSESHYMLGLAAKGHRAGFNVIRFNQRNCGGTEHLTPTLYHSGLSGDLLAVVEELASRDRLETIYLVGYSMGGNLALNAAGQIGAALAPGQGATHGIHALKGIGAVCPNIHPALAVEALERPRNWMYQRHFLNSLRARMHRKARSFPGRYDLSHLSTIRTLSEFDDRYTAPDAGFRNAAEYYERTGARHVISQIRLPTLMIVAKDDPFIPYQSFEVPALAANPWIQLVTSPNGGHCGFLQCRCPDEDMYWAENRLIEFFLALAREQNGKRNVHVTTDISVT